MKFCYRNPEDAWLLYKLIIVAVNVVPVVGAIEVKLEGMVGHSICFSVATAHGATTNKRSCCLVSVFVGKGDGARIIVAFPCALTFRYLSVEFLQVNILVALLVQACPNHIVGIGASVASIVYAGAHRVASL